MRRVAGVLPWLCACNQIFGLSKTKLQDAAIPFFDGTPDAPFGCPASGPPTYAPGFTQVVATGDCGGYNTSRTVGAAVTQCTITTNFTQPILYAGPADSSALAILTLTPTASPSSIQPKLSPDGDELWAVQLDATSTLVIRVYTPDGPPGPTATSWVKSYDIVPPTPPSDVGTPMRAGPGRRAVYLDTLGALQELVQQGDGSWIASPIAISAKTRMVSMSSVPNLSPDGLRMVFAGGITQMSETDGVVYSWRPDLATPFSNENTMLVPGPPVMAMTPFMTEDCSRMYFSGLSSVFYITEVPPQ